jgi:hypothetical protein
MTTVSIALATFNGEQHIPHQLTSFVRQDRLPDELVVCDDGSTDRTLELVQEFADMAPFRVSVHRNSARLGYSQNFSKAMSLCQGDIILLSDQDDIWFANKVMKIVEEHEVQHSLVYVHRLVLSSSIGKDSYTSLGDTGSIRLTKGCATAVSSELLTVALPVPRSWAHDVWIHALGHRLDSRTVIDEPLQIYRIHLSQTSGVLPSKDRILKLPRKLAARSVSASGPLLAQRLEMMEDLLDRLQCLSLEEPVCKLNSLEGAQREVGRELSAIRARLDIVELPTFRDRLFAILRSCRHLFPYDYKDPLEIARDLLFAR